MQQLGIEHIAAYSPEARGRSERAFRTLQDRLPKELRLAGITTVAEANAWLAATYLAQHNAQFAFPPESTGTAFVADTMGVGPETLCIQDTRVVANDNTIAWNSRRLQIPASRCVRTSSKRRYVYMSIRTGRSASSSAQTGWRAIRLKAWNLLLPRQTRAWHRALCRRHASGIGRSCGTSCRSSSFGSDWQHSG
jgi:hypothetical protein